MLGGKIRRKVLLYHTCPKRRTTILVNEGILAENLENVTLINIAIEFDLVLTRTQTVVHGPCQLWPAAKP
jgi:hypothetical protein